MESRRLLIAALLSMAVIFLWQALFVEAPPPPDPVSAPVERPAGPFEPTSPDRDAEPRDEDTPPPEPVHPPVDPDAPPVEGTMEERVTLESDQVRAVFTNRGAQLVSYELKLQRNGTEGVVNLVHPRAEGPWPFGLMGSDGEPLAANRALFVRERPGRDAVAFHYRGAEGEVRKEFRLEPNGMLSVRIRAQVGRPWATLIGPAVRDVPGSEFADRFAVRQGVWLTGGNLGKLTVRKANAPEVVSGTGLDWAGLEDNYFLAAILPHERLDRVVYVPYLVDPPPDGSPPGLDRLPSVEEMTGTQADLEKVLGLWIFPRGEELSARAYLGDKRLETLKALPGDLDRTVLPGIRGVLARPLLYGLNWTHNRLGVNYGWAIVLMTIVIKIVLFPLTHKSYVSMQKMQVLNPKVQAIRSKYRPKLRDKKGRPNLEAQRQMNDEMMALYRSEGINPAGGCLPMVLQLPILFAFYWMLYSAVELRGAPWVLWIHDLSIYDPFYVLPIVMGASQFIQTKMTPMMGSPMQQRIFLLMPVFFTILFLKFPAGLVLYWLVNNVLTIGQQWLIRRISPAAQPAAGPQKAKAS